MVRVAGAGLRGGGLAGAREIRRSRPQAMEFRVRVGEREAESAFPGSGQAGDIARTAIGGEVYRRS